MVRVKRFHVLEKEAQVMLIVRDGRKKKKTNKLLNQELTLREY
jgi:hypothetical protein